MRVNALKLKGAKRQPNQAVQAALLRSPRHSPVWVRPAQTGHSLPVPPTLALSVRAVYPLESVAQTGVQ